jgi:flagellar basal-body rod protein FlgG
MDDLMIMATSLMARETRRVETAAHNIANTATPGFKSETTFEDALVNPAASGWPTSSSMRRATDFSPGKLMHTGNPLDLAIGGDGFFAVAAPGGTAYTRGGSFHRDEQGRLVTIQGWPLQASGGGEVIVSNGAWHIEPDGTVIDGGNPTTVIDIAHFDDNGKLERSAEGLFLAGQAHVVDREDTRIQQGYLEASNVMVGVDMVRVMEAMRRVESGQKLVQSYDDMVGNVLQRLGDMQS